MTPTPSQHEALEYVRNTGGDATRAHFIEDFAPVGARLWRDLTQQGLVEERGAEGHLYLTAAGEAALGTQEGDAL